MTCAAQQDRHLLRASIDRGLAYTDTAPELALWRDAEELATAARRTGARILLGAGLMPGISNLMARWLANALGRVERIETAILLGLGDDYGPDSLRYVLDAMTEHCTVIEDGRWREAAAFSEGRKVEFPSPIGARTAYLFPWSDVAHYPRTLGAKSALGRIALEPVWTGRLISRLVETRMRDWLRRPEFLERGCAAVERLRHLYVGRDRFALVVTAECRGRVLRASLAGRGQADATAAGAAELCRALAAHEIAEAGVWVPEQIVEHQRFFGMLTSLGYTPTLESVTATLREARRTVPTQEVRP
jgi:saccharopine dehydrogenase-like NADP-dependent oxidoreductase